MKTNSSYSLWKKCTYTGDIKSIYYQIPESSWSEIQLLLTNKILKKKNTHSRRTDKRLAPLKITFPPCRPPPPPYRKWTLRLNFYFENPTM